MSSPGNHKTQDKLRNRGVDLKARRASADWARDCSWRRG